MVIGAGRVVNLVVRLMFWRIEVGDSNVLVLEVVNSVLPFGSDPIKISGTGFNVILEVLSFSVAWSRNDFGKDRFLLVVVGIVVPLGSTG